MCREIDHILYDTASSTVFSERRRILACSSTVDKKFTYGKPGDPDGFEETLYITNDGKYFIYTNGGPLSKYPTENITPIEREDVKNWMLSR